MDKPDHEIIATPEGLHALCGRLRDSPWLALDTEFIREKTYYPRLCLIQIAGHSASDRNFVACIDPLALNDQALAPLYALFEERRITKVLHAAQQDMEIFSYRNDHLPQPVFDTQIAAALLGYGEQTGYAALAEAVLGVKLEKSQTRTDWSQRPLDAQQIEYALDDVRYLGEIYSQLVADLEARGRLHWLADDFAALSQAQRYRADPDAAWKRVKSAGRLRGVKLNVLRALAAWRERRAMAADRPRRWILGDDVLLGLAQQMPDSLAKLEKQRGLSDKKIDRDGQALLEIIAQARRAPRETWPALPIYRPLSSAQEALLDAMTAVLRLRATEHDISLSALASRKDLERLLLGDSDNPVLRGWRATLVGRDLQALLNGERHLQVHDGELRLVPVAACC